MSQKNMPKKRDGKDKKGFTLIELLVAMFIFIVIMGAMVAVSLAGFRSYIKSRAIKVVTEDVGFALNSIAKDVRMGKVENATGCIGTSLKDCLMITRNATQEKVCYRIDDKYLAVNKIPITMGCPIYTDEDYNKIVDLSDTEMNFDTSTSGFYSCETDTSAIDPSTCFTTASEKGRGWAEINLNIENPTMETDSISVQTIVSSRDYGWEEL